MGTPDGGADSTAVDCSGTAAQGPASFSEESRLLEAFCERLIAINARGFERLEARLDELRRDLLGGRVDCLPLAELGVLLSAPRPPWAEDAAKPPLDTDDEVEAPEVTPQRGMDESHTTSWRPTRGVSITELEDMARLDTAQEIALSEERKLEAKQPPQLPAHRRFAGHPAFEGLFGFATIAYAVVMGVQVDYVARRALPEAPVPFQAVTVALSLLFMVELVCNLWCERKAFFLSGKRAWNLLDVALVLSSLPELLIPMLGSSANSNVGQARLLRILRVTRIIRLVRIGRVVRFIRALRTLVHQIASTLRSLVWGLLLLVLLMYGFGIMFTQTVNSLITDGGAALSAEEVESARRFWSTLPRSMFTLYESVTGGISWNEVVAPFDEMSLLLFGTYIALTQLAVLNVLTGVFCQNAIDSARRDLDIATQTMMANKERYVVQLRELFENLDTNGSGAITISELDRHLQDERVQAYFESLELEASDAWALFKLVDEDQGNTLDIKEFVEGCMRLRGHAKQIDVHILSAEQRRFQQRCEDSMKRIEDAIGKAVVPGPIQKPSWNVSGMVGWA